MAYPVFFVALKWGELNAVPKTILRIVLGTVTEEIFGAQQKSQTEARRKFQERLPSELYPKTHPRVESTIKTGYWLFIMIML